MWRCWDQGLPLELLGVTEALWDEWEWSRRQC